MVTCVVTLIKDEHRYLQEYIEYYINLGIDTIFIYEDMNSKSHKEICDKYNNVIYLKLFEEITTEEKNRWINQEMPEYRVELLFKAFYRKYKELYDAVFFL